jgi:outer membrane protein assembly factor BamB
MTTKETRTVQDRRKGISLADPSRKGRAITERFIAGLAGCFALTIGVLLFTVVAASAQTGTLIGTVDFSQQCGSGLGVGITFDGTNLWYSCDGSNPDLYKADPSTGNVIASYNIANGLGSLAYDASRNVIWAGPGAGTFPFSNVIQIPLDASKNVSGPYAIAFPVNEAGFCGLDDGLAIDLAPTTQPPGGNGILYFSCDGSQNIYKYDAVTGSFLGSIPAAGPDSLEYNSGVAIGGSLLFEGSDGASHVFVVDKDTLAAQFDFSTIVASDTNFRDESLTCDPKTFLPSLGVQVMWSKEAFAPMRAHAYEIPLNTCGSGGQPPPNTNACPLSQGFWKNHNTVWPVTSLTLGGNTYTEAQLLVILATPPKGDASLILADQLIAAKLNIANGSDPTPINSALASADGALAAVGALPGGIKANTAAGQAMIAVAATLNQYNNDQLTPSCTAKVPGQ